MAFPLNPWLFGSAALLLLWLAIWLFRPALRREMLLVSLFTAPLGLTEPLFVPEYWTPPSLFNLAATTGFDIESIVFCFAAGGIAAVIYEILVKSRHSEMSMNEMRSKRHRFHKIALASPAIVFVPLYLFSGLNPIYVSIIALFAGAMATVVCRPDLKKPVLTGGTVFLLIYFFFFLFLSVAFPDFVPNAWNFSAISGILVFGVPFEELLFALSFGMAWAGLYEHFFWKKLVR
ncbi:MAG: hypothetical protein HY394_02275 [Candidatus Diapherotrites archaeon]|nr:hypothetical protein [Candidatus Diapherotrites archaeon]